MTGPHHMLRRVQAAAALAAAPVADRTAGSVLIHLGTRVEKFWRGAYALYLNPVAKFYGLATRAEVLRVREEVALLDYRLEALQAERLRDPQSGAP